MRATPCPGSANTRPLGCRGWPVYEILGWGFSGKSAVGPIVVILVVAAPVSFIRWATGWRRERSRPARSGGYPARHREGGGTDTLLIDQEAVYAPRQGNDRLLLVHRHIQKIQGPLSLGHAHHRNRRRFHRALHTGRRNLRCNFCLSQCTRPGSLNEYELDLLRHRSLAARYEKARRGEYHPAHPTSCCQSRLLRAKRETSRAATALTLPRQTSATMRSQPAPRV
jgi:hypothetical protein